MSPSKVSWYTALIPALGKQKWGNLCDSQSYRIAKKKKKLRMSATAGQWWHRPLIPALERQRQVDFLKPAWSTEWVPGQPGLPRETLSREKKKKDLKPETQACLLAYSRPWKIAEKI
jgi:hypothetical protein